VIIAPKDRLDFAGTWALMPCWQHHAQRALGKKTKMSAAEAGYSPALPLPLRSLCLSS